MRPWDDFRNNGRRALVTAIVPVLTRQCKHTVATKPRGSAYRGGLRSLPSRLLAGPLGRPQSRPEQEQNRGTTQVSEREARVDRSVGGKHGTAFYDVPRTRPRC